MKWLTFDEVAHREEHYHGSAAARFAIDWELEEQKYKEPLRGVRVYESGRIELHKNGYRDPYWRKAFHQLLGLEFLSPRRNFSNCNFFTVDGDKVTKKEVMADLVLYDDSLMRLYNVSNWHHRGTGKLTFFHKNAQPVNTATIVLRKDNNTRFATAMDALKEHLALGATLNQLEPDKRYRFGLQWANEAQLLKPPTDLTVQRTRDFCRNIDSCRHAVASKLQYETQDIAHHDYLVVKFKEK